MDTYKINIEGLDRELRKFPVSRHGTHQLDQKST